MSWIFELQAQQELEGLHRVVASIHEVTHENVSSLRDFSTFVEKFEEVVELSVNVSANSYWCSHGLDIGFFDENFFNLFTEDSQVSLRKDIAVLDCFEPLININLATHISFLTNLNYIINLI